MAKTRKHEFLETAEAPSSSPSPKRTRRSTPSSTFSSDSKQGPHSGPASVNAEGGIGLAPISSPTSLQIHLSAPVSNDAGEKDKDSSSSKQSSPHTRVPSGIEGLYFPDDYYACSTSPLPEHPSGIEGHSFPDCYDNSPSPPSGRVPSGIEGYCFPNFNTEACSSPSSSLDTASTVMTIDVVRVTMMFEKQYHFYNDSAARNRGAAIIDSARSIINRPRGSPTAKNKVLKLQKIAREEPRRGENDFMNSFMCALLNEARMVPNVPVPCTQALTVADFAADPRARKEDFLAQPADGTFEQIFGSLPKLQIPEPDLLYGLDDDLLPNEYSAIFESARTKPLCKVIRHPFLAGEFKTPNRPIGEARLQCQRAGSAIVSYSADWTDEVDGKPEPESLTKLPQVDLQKDTSTPDPKSFCFTAAISSETCYVYVNWKEEWSSGAVYYHQSLLDTYSMESGMEAQAEKFQSDISNIIDWGVLERAKKIYDQARTVTKRKVGNDDDLPEIRPKRQRVDTSDDSD